MRARPTTAARSRLAAGAALLLAGTLGLGGCAGTDSQGKDRAGRASSPSPTSPVSSSPTTSPRATAAPSASANRTPVGSATDPAVLGPGRDLLDWSPVPGSVKDTVTRGGGATLSVDEAGSRARLEAKGASVTITATSRQQVSDALLDGSWAVVVLRDRQDVPARQHHGRAAAHPARAADPAPSRRSAGLRQARVPRQLPQEMSSS